MGLDDLLDDDEAEAGAFDLRRRAAQPLVLGEQPGLDVERDAAAGVLDAQLDGCTRAPQAHRHPAAGGSELEGVGDQVAHHLGEAAPIAEHDGGLAGLERELQAPRGGERQVLVVDAGADRDQVHLAVLDLELRRLHLRDVEEVADHVHQLAHPEAHLLQLRLHLVGERAAHPLHQHLRAHLQRGQRRAQVVRHHRVEVHLPPLAPPHLGDVPQRDGGVAEVVVGRDAQVRRIGAAADLEVGRNARRAAPGQDQAAEAVHELFEAALVHRGSAAVEHPLGLGVDEDDPACTVESDHRVGQLGQHPEQQQLGVLGPLTQQARADQRVHPRAELRRRVGLGEIVVGACVEAFHHLLHLLVGGQQQQAQRGGLGAGADELADVDARDPRHHPVHHQHVGRRARGQLLQQHRAVVEQLHVIAAREGAPGHLGLERAVVHDPSHPAACGRSVTGEA